MTDPTGRAQDPITDPEYARDWLKSTLWSFQGNWFLPISDEDDAETVNRIMGDRADWILGRLRGIQ